MPGGLLQIAASGSQDIILTGNPELSFFKTVYKKYSNFSQETKNIINKNVLSFGDKTKIEIPKNGDLLQNMYYKVKLPTLKSEYIYTPDEEIQQILTDNNTFITDETLKTINLKKIYNLENYYNNNAYITRTQNNEYLYTQDTINNGEQLDFENVNADRIISQLYELRIQSDSEQYKYLTKNNMNDNIINGSYSDNITNNLSQKIAHITKTDNIYYTIYFNTDLSSWTIWDNVYKKLSVSTKWLTINDSTKNINNFVRYGYIYQLSGDKTRYIRIAKVKIDNFTNNSIVCSLVEGTLNILASSLYYFSNIDLIDTNISPEVDYSIDLYDDDTNVIICIGDKRNRKVYYYIYDTIGNLLNDEKIIVNDITDNDFGQCVKIIDKNYLCVSAPLINTVYIYQLVNYDYDVNNVQMITLNNDNSDPININTNNKYQIINSDILFGYSIDHYVSNINNKEDRYLAIGMPNYNFNGGVFSCKIDSNVNIDYSNVCVFSYNNIPNVKDYIRSSLGYSVKLTNISTENKNPLLLIGSPYSYQGIGSVVYGTIQSNINNSGYNLNNLTILKPTTLYNFSNVEYFNSIIEDPFEGNINSNIININTTINDFIFNLSGNIANTVISGLIYYPSPFYANIIYNGSYIGIINSTGFTGSVSGDIVGNLYSSFNINGNSVIGNIYGELTSNLIDNFSNVSLNIGQSFFGTCIDSSDNNIVISGEGDNEYRGGVWLYNKTNTYTFNELTYIDKYITPDKPNDTSEVRINSVSIKDSITQNGNVVLLSYGAYGENKKNGMIRQNIYEFELWKQENVFENNVVQRNFGKQIKMNKTKDADYMLISGVNRADNEQLSVWLYRYDKITREWIQNDVINLSNDINTYSYQPLSAIPITNISTISQITTSNENNTLKANISLQMVDDPYGYIINYIDALNYNNDIKTNNIYTSNKFLNDVTDFINFKQFNYVNTLILPTIPNWTYKTITINDLTYELIYLYTKTIINNTDVYYKHVGTAQILKKDNNFFTVSILVGRIDLLNIDISYNQIYVSPIGFDDKYLINNYNISPMNLQTNINVTPDYICQVLYNVTTGNDELKMYNRSLKANNKFVQDRYEDTTKIIYINIDTDVKFIFNYLPPGATYRNLISFSRLKPKIGIDLIQNNNNILKQIINYPTHTIMQIQIVQDTPITDIDDNSYIMFSSNRVYATYAVKMVYFKLIDADNQIYEIYLNENNITAFFKVIFINKTLIDFTNVDTTEIDTLLEMQGIALDEVNNTIIGKYKFIYNQKENKINNIQNNSYVYIDGIPVGKILNFKIIDYDNIVSFKYNNDTSIVKNTYQDNKNIINNVYTNLYKNYFTDYRNFHANIDGSINGEDNDTALIGFSGSYDNTDIFTLYQNNLLNINTPYENLLEEQLNQYDYYLKNEFNNQVNNFINNNQYSQAIELAKRIIYYKFFPSKMNIKLSFNTNMITDLFIGNVCSVYSSLDSDIVANIFINDINLINNIYNTNLISGDETIIHLRHGNYVKSNFGTFYKLDSVYSYWNNFEDNILEYSLNRFTTLDETYFVFQTNELPITGGNLSVPNILTGTANLSIVGNIRVDPNTVIIQCAGGDYNQYKKLYSNVIIGTNCIVDGFSSILPLHDSFKIQDSHLTNHLLLDYWMRTLNIIFPNYNTLENPFLIDSIQDNPIQFNNIDGTIQNNQINYTYHNDSNIEINLSDNIYNIVEYYNNEKYLLGEIEQYNTGLYKISSNSYYKRILNPNIHIRSIDGNIYHLENINYTNGYIEGLIYGLNINLNGNIYDGNVLIGYNNLDYIYTSNISDATHTKIILSNLSNTLVKEINYSKKYLISEINDQCTMINFVGENIISFDKYVYDIWDNLITPQKYSISFSSDVNDTKYGYFMNSAIDSYYFTALTSDNYINIGTISDIQVGNVFGIPYNISDVNNIFNITDNTSYIILNFSSNFLATAITIGKDIILRKNSNWKTYNYCVISIINIGTNQIIGKILKRESMNVKLLNNSLYLSSPNPIILDNDIIQLDRTMISVGDNNFVQIYLPIYIKAYNNVVYNNINWFDNIVLGSQLVLREYDIITSNKLATLNVLNTITQNTDDGLGNVSTNCVVICSVDNLSQIFNNQYYIYGNNINIPLISSYAADDTKNYDITAIISNSYISSFPIGTNISFKYNYTYEIMNGLVSNLDYNNGYANLHITISNTDLYYKLVPEKIEETVIYGNIYTKDNIKEKLQYYNIASIGADYVYQYELNNHLIKMIVPTPTITIGNVYPFSLDFANKGNILIYHIIPSLSGSVVYGEYLDNYENFYHVNIPKQYDLTINSLVNNESIVIDNINCVNNTVTIVGNVNGWISNLSYGNEVYIKWGNINLTSIQVNSANNNNLIGNLIDFNYEPIFLGDKQGFLNQIIKYNNLKYNNLLNINDNIDRTNKITNNDNIYNIANLDTIGYQFNFSLNRIQHNEYLYNSSGLLSEQFKWISLDSYNLKNNRRTVQNLLTNVIDIQKIQSFNINSLLQILNNYQENIITDYNYNDFINLINSDFEKYTSFNSTLKDINLSVGNSSYMTYYNIEKDINYRQDLINNMISSSIHNGIVFNSVPIITGIVTEINLYNYQLLDYDYSKQILNVSQLNVSQENLFSTDSTIIKNYILDNIKTTDETIQINANLSYQNYIGSILPISIPTLPNICHIDVNSQMLIVPAMLQPALLTGNITVTCDIIYKEDDILYPFKVGSNISIYNSDLIFNQKIDTIKINYGQLTDISIDITIKYDQINIDNNHLYSWKEIMKDLTKIKFLVEYAGKTSYMIGYNVFFKDNEKILILRGIPIYTTNLSSDSEIYFINNLQTVRKYTQGNIDIFNDIIFEGNVFLSSSSFKWDNKQLTNINTQLNNSIINKILINQVYYQKYEPTINNDKYIFDNSIYSSFLNINDKLTLENITQTLSDNFTRYYNDCSLLDIYRKNYYNLSDIFNNTNIVNCLKGIVEKLNNLNTIVTTLNNTYENSNTSIYNENQYKGYLLTLFTNLDTAQLNNLTYLTNLFITYDLYVTDIDDDDQVAIKYTDTQISILNAFNNSSNSINIYLDNTLDDKQKILLFLLYHYHSNYVINNVLASSGKIFKETYFPDNLDTYIYYKGEIISLTEKAMLEPIISNIALVSNTIKYNDIVRFESEIPKMIFTHMRSYPEGYDYLIDNDLNSDRIIPDITSITDYYDTNNLDNNSRQNIKELIETIQFDSNYFMNIAEFEKYGVNILNYPINLATETYTGNIELNHYILYKNCLITDKELADIYNLNGNIIPSNQTIYNNLQWGNYLIGNLIKSNLDGVNIFRNNKNISNYTLWNDCIITINEEQEILEKSKYNANISLQIGGNLYNCTCGLEGYIYDNILGGNIFVSNGSISGNISSNTNSRGYYLNSLIDGTINGNLNGYYNLTSGNVIISNILLESEFIPNTIVKNENIYSRNTDLPIGFRYVNGVLERTMIYDNKKYKEYNDTYITDSLHQLLLYYQDENILSNYITTPYTLTDTNLQTILRNLLFNRNIVYNQGYNILYKFLNHKSLYWKNVLKIYDFKNSDLKKIFYKYNSSFFYTNQTKFDENFKVSDIYSIIKNDVFTNYYGIVNPYYSDTTDYHQIVISDKAYQEQNLKFTDDYQSAKTELLEKYARYQEIKPQITKAQNRNPNTKYANIKWVDYIGTKLIKDIKFVIGDQIINQFDGNWILLTSLLNGKYGHLRGYANMIGHNPRLIADSKYKDNYTIYQPIPFWFCFRKTMSLPLLNIIYNKVYVEVELEQFEKLIITEPYTKVIYDEIYDKPNFRLNLMCNYIFLEQDEREKLASMRHEYLIEQIQTQSIYKTMVGSNEVKLGFVNSVKELYWYCSDKNGRVKNVLDNITFKLDGIDRFKKTEEEYFSLIPFYENGYNIVMNGYNMYSFGIHTKSIMPSGTCNFSVIRNARMRFDSNGVYDLKMYAKSYNILRIMSGYAGLAYY
jgi:hypothetical protein